MSLSDTQVEKACDTLCKAINAAQNSNHNGEVFVVAAAQVAKLVEAMDGIVHFGDAVAFRSDPLSVELRKWIAVGSDVLALARGEKVA